MKNRYDTQYQIVLDSETKESFYRICHEKSINPSGLVRNYIEKFVEENKEVV